MTGAAEPMEQIEALEKEVYDKLQTLNALRRQAPHEPVQDHVLRGPGGEATSLSSLFGDKQDLIVVHNMGSSCPYCTMWADGFNGLLPHLEDRAAFVVVSPDDPETQAAFASSRGWRFRMVSNADSGFTEAMGYTTEHEGKAWAIPGCSTFRRADDGSVVRVAHAPFGPGDPFCGAWHLFDMLDGGTGEWQAKFTY